MMPIPPTCISTMSTTWPKTLRSCPTEITLSPHTARDVVEVNSAGTKSSPRPSVVETGSMSRRVPARFTMRKMVRNTRAGLRQAPISRWATPGSVA